MNTPELMPELAPLSLKDAQMAIAEVRQRVAQMGFNDSEFFDLDQIQKKLDSGELKPEEAVAEAHKLMNGKQDYH